MHYPQQILQMKITPWHILSVGLLNMLVTESSNISVSEKKHNCTAHCSYCSHCNKINHLFDQSAPYIVPCCVIFVSFIKFIWSCAAPGSHLALSIKPCSANQQSRSKVIEEFIPCHYTDRWEIDYCFGRMNIATVGIDVRICKRCRETWECNKLRRRLSNHYKTNFQNLRKKWEKARKERLRNVF